MDVYKNNSYNICCFDVLEYRCDQNSYSRIVYNIQECLPLSSGDIIYGCAHYAKHFENYHIPVFEFVEKAFTGGDLELRDNHGQTIFKI